MLGAVVLEYPPDIRHEGHRPNICDEHGDPQHALDEVQPENAVGKMFHQVHRAGRQDDEYADGKGQRQDHGCVKHDVPQAFAAEFLLCPFLKAARFVLFVIPLFQHFRGAHQCFGPVHERIRESDDTTNKRNFHPLAVSLGRLCIHADRAVGEPDCQRGLFFPFHHDAFHDGLPAHLRRAGILQENLLQVHKFPLSRFRISYPIYLAFRYFPITSMNARLSLVCMSVSMIISVTSCVSRLPRALRIDQTVSSSS